MNNYRSRFRWLKIHQTIGVFVTAIACFSSLSAPTFAQSGGTIAAGTTIAVRTNEEIDARTTDGRVFTGSVAEDVKDTRGQVAVPSGSYVEMLVRSVGANEYALDLDSVTINGKRLGVEAQTAVSAGQKDGLGTNERTGRYVGGGAVIGAIIGAIAGGGKGAAIGAGAGAATGAGAQVLTRGRNVNVPSESLLTFRLDQPLVTAEDKGFSRNGTHYHSGFGTTAGNTSAYDAGLKAGRADKQSSRAYNAQSNTFRGADLSDYQAGYERGFDESPSRPQRGNNTGSIQIGADHYITWKGPPASQVFVQVDDNPRRLFSSAASGNQPAPWISFGHKYVFVLEDPNGRELARDENDLRQRRYAR